MNYNSFKKYHLRSKFALNNRTTMIKLITIEEKNHRGNKLQ